MQNEKYMLSDFFNHMRNEEKYWPVAELYPDEMDTDDSVEDIVEAYRELMHSVYDFSKTGLEDRLIVLEDLSSEGEIQKAMNRYLDEIEQIDILVRNDINPVVEDQYYWNSDPLLDIFSNDHPFFKTRFPIFTTEEIMSVVSK
jgi:hypothetical protein